MSTAFGIFRARFTDVVSIVDSNKLEERAKFYSIGA